MVVFTRHFYKLDSTEPDFLVGLIYVLYFILFYFSKHDSSPYDILGKLKECGLESMDWFFLDILQKSSPSMLPSRLGMKEALF